MQQLYFTTVLAVGTLGEFTKASATSTDVMTASSQRGKHQWEERFHVF